MRAGIKNWWLVCILLSLPIILLQTFYFVSHEQTIYIWDYKNYWQQWINFSDLIKTPLRFFKLIVLDIYIDSNYNVTPILLLIPFYYLPFDLRTNYILGIAVLYYLPLLILINRLLLIFKSYQSYVWVFTITILTVTFIPFWGPTLRGYPDIIGLIPIVIVITFVMSYDLSQETKIKSVLLIGGLLWLAFLFRRWYAYTIVSLYITLPFLNLFIFNEFKNIQFKSLYNLFFCFLCAGLVTIGLSYFFQNQAIHEIIETRYSQVYSAYQFGVINSINVLYTNIGFFIGLLFLVGVVWAVIGKRTKEKSFVIFCLVNLIISFSLFVQAQTPGIHHCLSFSLWIFLVSIVGLKVILMNVCGEHKKRFMLICCMCVSILVSVVTLNKTKLENITTNILFPKKIYPLRLENINSYQELIKDLQNLTEKKEYISVFSSSYILTDQLLSILSNNSLNIVYGSQVDLRDKLILDVFKTDYVVITEPIQLHINPEGQRVISIPVDDIANHKTIGMAYKKLPKEYLLDDNVKAYIYYKTRTFTKSEMNDFIGKFIKFYPSWSNIYDEEKLKKLISDD